MHRRAVHQTSSTKTALGSTPGTCGINDDDGWTPAGSGNNAAVNGMGIPKGSSSSTTIDCGGADDFVHQSMSMSMSTTIDDGAGAGAGTKGSYDYTKNGNIGTSSNTNASTNTNGNVHINVNANHAPRTRHRRRRYRAKPAGISWRYFWNRCLSAITFQDGPSPYSHNQQRALHKLNAASNQPYKPRLRREDDFIDFILFTAQLVLLCAIVIGITFILFLSWHRWELIVQSNDAAAQARGEQPTHPWWNPFGLVSSSFRQHKKGHTINGNNEFDMEPIPPSKIYQIPHTMPHIGDKSDRYARLRKDMDEKMTSYYEHNSASAGTDGDGIVEWTPPAIDYWDLQQKPMETQTRFVRDEAHGGTGQHRNAAANQQSPEDLTDGDINGGIKTPQEPYDIYNCPATPPKGYPFEWNLMQLLTDWPPDDTNPRLQIHQGICVFDYQQDYEKAMAYREAELPFVTRNDPKVLEAVQRWNTPGYVNEMLGSVKHRTEYSVSNHFLYWNAPSKPQKGNKHGHHHRGWGGGYSKNKVPENWTSPTTMLRMTYWDWLKKANATTPTGEVDDDILGPNQPHWYFRLIGCGETGPHGECDAGSSEYLFDELPFFQPRPGDLYLKTPPKQRGIHCRFGMKGVIAENHFDGSRNSIVVLSGARRYILNHPNQCDRLHLYPKGHPSARHSQIDWSRPDDINLEDGNSDFAEATGNEVVLQAGDVLYLPTHWFHYIVSLKLNYQCNTRSGISDEYMDAIQECGF